MFREEQIDSVGTTRTRADRAVLQDCASRSSIRTTGNTVYGSLESRTIRRVSSRKVSFNTSYHVAGMGGLGASCGASFTAAVGGAGRVTPLMGSMTSAGVGSLRVGSATGHQGMVAAMMQVRRSGSATAMGSMTVPIGARLQSGWMQRTQSIDPGTLGVVQELLNSSSLDVNTVQVAVFGAAAASSHVVDGGGSGGTMDSTVDGEW